MRAAWPALLIAGLSACRTPAPQADMAAVIVAPDAASREDVQQAIDRMLNTSGILLADDALTSTSVLSIERRAVLDEQGLPANGREVGRPELFELVIRDGTCTLLHLRDGQRLVLGHTHCRASAQSQ